MTDETVKETRNWVGMNEMARSVGYTIRGFRLGSKARIRRQRSLCIEFCVGKYNATILRSYCTRRCYSRTFPDATPSSTCLIDFVPRCVRVCVHACMCVYT